MLIRPFHPRDASALAHIMHDSVHHLTCDHYTATQRAAWSPAPVTAAGFMAPIKAGREVFVAEDDIGQPVGFIELDPDGGIDRFYCAPKSAGRGIGAQLYQTLEHTARAQQISRLYVAASEVARPFFEARGYSIREKQDVSRRGVTLRNYVMEKPLRA